MVMTAADKKRDGLFGNWSYFTFGKIKGHFGEKRAEDASPINTVYQFDFHILRSINLSFTF